MFQTSEARLRQILLILLIVLAGFFSLSILWRELQTFSSIIFLFFAAWLISFVLSPVAGWLQRLRLSRIWAVALVYLMMAVILTALIVLSIPAISAQVQQIIQRVNVLSNPDNLQQINNQIVSILKSFGFSDHDAHQTIDDFTKNFQSSLRSAVTDALNNIADLLSSVANILLDMVIVLILSFYMMLDGRRLMDNMIDRLPIRWRTDVHDFEAQVGRIFGGFIRSQLIIGFSYGLLTLIALFALQVPNGYLISLIAGLVMIIPFVGPFLALVPPMALALLEVQQQDVLKTLIILLIALFIAQQIVMQVLAPRIMSQGVGLHPLWLFAALLIGAKEAGVWGAFFAAPVAALIAVILRTAYDRWSSSSPLYAVKPAIVADVMSEQNGLVPEPAIATVPITPKEQSADVI